MIYGYKCPHCRKIHSIAQKTCTKSAHPRDYLENCPLCDSDVIVERKYDPRNFGNVCNGCGLETGVYKTQEEANTTWNTRPGVKCVYNAIEQFSSGSPATDKSRGLFANRRDAEELVEGFKYGGYVVAREVIG